MSTAAEKAESIKNSGAAAAAKEGNGLSAAAALPDRRPAAVAQRQAQAAIAGSLQLQQAATLQRAIDSSPRQQAAPAPVQQQENRTGLPDALKAGVENLSGHSLDDVQVHYNSAKPAQLQAHAYAQGTDIHVAPGQEQHLPHEAWHVVQQKQGRVRPTTQLKGKVAVNDNAGLEREADVMGAKALAAPGATTQLRARAVPAAAPVQLVRDKTQRPVFDGRIDTLKAEVILTLQKMGAVGEDWESKYGEQGKAKGESVLDGKKTDYPAEIRKAALNKLWEQLTPSQKIELARKAAQLTGKAISEAVQGGSQATSALLEPSGTSEVATSEKKPKPSEKQPDKQAKQEESASALLPGWLSELTLDDINKLRKAYSFVSDILDEYDKAKSAVQKKAGEIGEAVGGQVGKLRDDISFKDRMSKLQQEFIAARKKYQALEDAISKNEDSDRYESELQALSYGLRNIGTGPAKVYLRELGTEERKNYPQVCQEAIAHIRASAHGGFGESFVAAAKKAMGAVGKFLGVGQEEEAAMLQQAQSELASKLSTVVNKRWGEFTTFYSTPDTVSEIKKALPTKRNPKAQLETAIELATAAHQQASRHRAPETQNFYDALAGLDVNDLLSVKITKSTIEEIEAKLG